MPYYKPCPNCGANLDPGEKCDCQNKKMPAGAATPSGQTKNNFIVIVQEEKQFVK